MNIVAILASGVGNRFDSKIPKQFHRICNKMVIEYVIEAVVASKSTDKIIIATDVENNYAFFDDLLSKYPIELINGGTTRNHSLGNVIQYVDETYDCQKLIVCDSVRPLITPQLIESYFDFLDDYDVVVTAQKITDSLGCLDTKKVFRERYYFMQSPEAFNFDILKNNFDSESALTEVAQQLPDDAKIKLYFDFKNNFKLTYPEDLKYFESIISANNNEIDCSNIVLSVHRFARYIYENYSKETKDWTERLQKELPALLKKWQITDYKVNKSSHFGLLFFCKSVKYGKCVVKIIPPFINRYKQERSCYQYLSNSVMCQMYDYDDGCCAILLEEIETKILPDFNNNPKLYVNYFYKCCNQKFKHSFNDDTDFINYQNELKSKLNENKFTYQNEKIMGYVKKANNVFEKAFDGVSQTLIHGDLHIWNILSKDGELLAIDPIGYIAPMEFNVARFIGTQLTDDMKNAKVNYQLLLSSFSTKFDMDKIKAAMFIDVVFRLHNSIFENSEYSLADKWIKIINDVLEN